MVSKSRLILILPMLFKMAFGYYYYQETPFSDSQVNQWGWDDNKSDGKVVKIGSIGGGYYGSEITGLRPHEKGDAGNRTYGHYAKSYPYRFEPERTLNKDTLEPLSAEARLRFLVEPFREHVFNQTGQLPTLKEVKKMRGEFMKFVKKELNLSDKEIENLFGTVATRHNEGKLPSYLLFDDMDIYDFDPVEALKYMPHIPKNATKEEIDNAYLRAWEILGKSDDKLRRVYDAYRRKYLKKNPFGPIMTEKEFLLYSIKLRENEAIKLGYVPSYSKDDPILRNIEISVFLRNALKDEYEKYRAKSNKDRFSSSRNFVDEALFTEKLIYENESEDVLPSPYDPIEGRVGVDTITDDISIINVTEANDNIYQGKDILDHRGKVLLKNADSGSDQDLDSDQNQDSDQNPDSDSEKIPKLFDPNRKDEAYRLLTIGHIKKYIYPKSPSQLRFESSLYSTSAQKRVIDKLSEYTLVDINEIEGEEYRAFLRLLIKTQSSEADTKAQTDYYKQRIGEQGKDFGTHGDVYEHFLKEKSLFFIPKSINDKFESNIIYPISAAGFEIKKKIGGKATIYHKETDTSFDIDYSGPKSFYLKGYLGLLNKNSISTDLNMFFNSNWEITESQVPSASRLLYDFDQKIEKLMKLDKSLVSILENLEYEKETELVEEISERLTKKSHVLKKYEHSRDEYLKNQEKLLDSINKFKGIFRSGIASEGLNKIISSLRGDFIQGENISGILKNLNTDQIYEFEKEYNELNEANKREYRRNKRELKSFIDATEDSFNDYLDSCSELIRLSTETNLFLSDFDQEMIERYKDTLDQNYDSSELLDLIQKVELIYNSQVLNSKLLLESHLRSSIQGYVRRNGVPDEIREEIMDILKGKRKANDYIMKIKFNQRPHQYYVVNSESPFEFSDNSSINGLKEEKVTIKDSSTSTDKNDMDEKVEKHGDRVKIVFEESIALMEEFVRDLFVSTDSHKERMKELLNMESSLLNEISVHRLSLETVLKRGITFQDELITNNESSELMLRIKLKIHETKTKLIYIADVIDKFYLYPYYLRSDSKKVRKLRKFEEEGLRSRYGFSYKPRFIYDDDGRYITGIYDFERIDGITLRNSLFERLSQEFKRDMEAWKLDLEIFEMVSTLRYPELEMFFYSPSYGEMSLFSRRMNLIKLLKPLLKKEKNESRRRKLKRSYSKLRNWLDDVKKFEESFSKESKESKSKESEEFKSSKSTKLVKSEIVSEEEKKPKKRIPSRIRRSS